MYSNDYYIMKIKYSPFTSFHNNTFYLLPLTVSLYFHISLQCLSLVFSEQVTQSMFINLLLVNNPFTEITCTTEQDTTFLLFSNDCIIYQMVSLETAFSLFSLETAFSLA